MTIDVIGHVSPVTADVWLDTLFGLVVHMTQAVPPLRHRWKPGLSLRLDKGVGAGTFALTRKSFKFLHLE